MQGMAAQFQAVSFAHSHGTAGQVKVEKLRQHGEHFRIADQLHSGISLRDPLYTPRMVRLQMADHQIIRFLPIQHTFHILHPLFHRARVHRIHDRDLFIHDHI